MKNFNLHFGMHEIKGTIVKDLPDELVAACPTLRSAIRLAMSQSIIKRDDATWANLLGVTPGNFSNLINGDVNRSKRPRNIPDNWFTDIPLLAGNNAIAQWQAMMPRKLTIQAQIEEAERELKRLQQKVA